MRTSYSIEKEFDSPLISAINGRLIILNDDDAEQVVAEIRLLSINVEMAVLRDGYCNYTDFTLGLLDMDATCFEYRRFFSTEDPNFIASEFISQLPFKDPIERFIIVELIQTEASERRKGFARQLLQDALDTLTTASDHVFLTPHAMDNHGMTTIQLRKWYDRMGFIPLKHEGRHAAMVRYHPEV